MAVGISDFNETENFEEYNPHPYQGGYDIALTYGNPLLPSSAFCYPISGASWNPPLSPKVPLPSVPVESHPSPEASEGTISTSVGREDGVPEVEYGSSYGYGERGFTCEDWWWNLSGFSPYMMVADGKGLGGWRYDPEELRYWSRLRRAADYIFGYSQGFGERRIGVDSYGIPIYACKRNVSDTVHAEIEPARTEKLEYHRDSLHSERVSLWSSTDNSREDENYRFSDSTHAYLKQHAEQPFDAEVDPVESVFSSKHSHHEFYDEQMYPETKLVPLSHGESRNGVNLHGNLEVAYDTHYYGAAQNVQLEAVESSFQKLSYHEASQEFSYTHSNWEPSYNIHGDESNTFTNAYHDYERPDYLQPSDIQLEPYTPTWAQYPGHYEISEEEVHTGSQPFQMSDYSDVYHESPSPRSAWQTPFGECGTEGKFCNSEYAYQSHHDDHSLELEPFKPTWMLNPNYYDTYEEISAPYKQLQEQQSKARSNARGPGGCVRGSIGRALEHRVIRKGPERECGRGKEHESGCGRRSHGRQ